MSVSSWPYLCPCIDKRICISTDMPIDMRIDMPIDMPMDMRTDMRIDISIDMRIDRHMLDMHQAYTCAMHRSKALVEHVLTAF